MSNVTCASEAELDRLASLNFVIFQFVDLTTALITFILSYFAVSVVLKQSIFEVSTKILLFLNLFFANLFQLTYSIEAVILIYKHFFKQNKICELLQLETSCSPYTKLIMCGTGGMIFCQTGMIFERAFATFLKDYKGKNSLIIGCSIAFLVFMCSSLTGTLIFWDDPLSGAVLACFVFPKQSAGRSTVYFFVCTGITLFNLAFSVLLNKYNMKFEYEIRFKISARFQKREVIESTETICFLTITQLILIFIYSFGIAILKSIRSSITARTYYFWISWFYTVPFIAMFFPLLLIYRIRISRAYRAKKIIGISSVKLTQDDHINQMNFMWR